MSALLIVIHIIVCIALIMIVLLQTGKGQDMGAAFGGGASNTLFGSTGASTFLGKATTAAAIIFMITSLTLAYMSGHRLEGSVITDVEVNQTSDVAEPVPDPARIEDAVLGPVGAHGHPPKKGFRSPGSGKGRAWKGNDWDALVRLRVLYRSGGGQIRAGAFTAEGAATVEGAP
ncbi:preprotein translocase subunit SecG [Desulfococcus sp.]|uniref:preprotein translocase subunit SecG n=1 Tax=Desulfococcus sp. TaxID=2025834 RepID=UPI0035947D4C